MSIFVDYSDEPKLDHRGGLGYTSKFHVITKPVKQSGGSVSSGSSFGSSIPSKKFNRGTIMSGVSDSDLEFSSDEESSGYLGDSPRDEGTAEDWAEWSDNVTTPGWLEEDMAEGP